MMSNTAVDVIREKEFEAAQQEAAKDMGIYEHLFKTPFCYEGKAYDKMTFEFNNLTGRDGLAIENEMQARGKPVVIPAFSGEYLVRMAARACTDRIGIDAIEAMTLADYNGIRSAARSFLLRSE